MNNVSLFCKSYHGDIERAISLANSVREYNRSNLPLFFSVPQKDIALFKNQLGNEGISWLSDEEIISANSKIQFTEYQSLPGHISQQIVKSEFWRLNPQSNYLCIDSDCRFIRNFHSSELISVDGIPYTLIHEGKNYSQFCLTHRLQDTHANFSKIQAQFRDFFGRSGPAYNFGPFPVLWNAQVWRDLEHNIFAPQNITILDAILLLPSEAFWYGEALLKYKSIPLLPREPFFKAYLYFEEYEQDRRAGNDESILAVYYMGVVYQSNWYPKRLQPLKRIAYKFKSALRNIR